MIYNAPSSYDDILPVALRVIAGMSWFSRTAVLADAAQGYAQLELYAGPANSSGVSTSRL